MTAAKARVAAPDVVGCYELLDGPWYTDSARIDVAWTSWLPRRFRLTGDRVDQNSLDPGGYRVVVLDSAPRIRLEFWRIAGDTAIQVGLSGHMSNGLMLIPGDSGMRGYAFTATDVVVEGRPNELRRDAAVNRIACPGT